MSREIGPLPLIETEGATLIAFLPGELAAGDAGGANRRGGDRVEDGDIVVHVAHGCDP